MKALIHDGLVIGLYSRQLNLGKLHPDEYLCGAQSSLSDEHLAALIHGLPWQRLGAADRAVLLFWPQHGRDCCV
jgi:transposase